MVSREGQLTGHGITQGRANHPPPEIRDRAYGGKRRWHLFSGLFVLLRLLGQVSGDLLREALRQVTILLRQMLLPRVPTHA